MQEKNKKFIFHLHFGRKRNRIFNLGTIHEKKALNGVNLHLDDGDFVTIIGGNGAESIFLNRETEIHKSERINKFTVDDVCPDYYWVDFEKDQSDWQGRTKSMTNLVIDLILPCNIIFSFMIKFSSKIAQDFMVILIISILIQVFCVILGSVLYNKCSVKRKKCLRYATICSNAGFLGNPIAQGVYGMMGLTLASIYLIPQRIMMWSEGVSVFTEAPTKKEMLKKIFSHPCIIACEIGVVLMLTGWRPPHFLQETITSISNCNTAMSMLVIGMILADADPRTLVDKDVLFYSVIRLIIIPFCVFIPC